MHVSSKELFYENFSSQWDRKINKRETEKRLKVVFNELLEGHSLKGAKVLEIGCGLGYFSERAYKLGAKVTGVDVGKNLLKISKKRVPKGIFILGSASQLPFSKESFDFVLCTEVIEHVENQRKAIEEMFRVIKKGGMLVITSPNRFFKPLFDFLSKIGVRPYHGNEKWYYPTTLKGILSKKGKILKEHYFNFLFPIDFFNRLEKFKQFRNLMINQGYLVKKI